MTNEDDQARRNRFFSTPSRDHNDRAREQRQKDALRPVKVAQRTAVTPPQPLIVSESSAAYWAAEAERKAADHEPMRFYRQSRGRKR